MVRPRSIKFDPWLDMMMYWIVYWTWLKLVLGVHTIRIHTWAPCQPIKGHKHQRIFEPELRNKVIKGLMSSVWSFHLVWDESNPTVKAHRGNRQTTTHRMLQRCLGTSRHARYTDTLKKHTKIKQGQNGRRWQQNWSRNWVRRRHAAAQMRARLENPNYTAIICHLQSPTFLLMPHKRAGTCS